jgi:hypothetical protein
MFARFCEVRVLRVGQKKMPRGRPITSRFLSFCLFLLRLFRLRASAQVQASRGRRSQSYQNIIGQFYFFLFMFVMMLDAFANLVLLRASTGQIQV